MEGVPVTTASRALLDLAAELAPRELERLAAQAERAGLSDDRMLRQLLERHSRHRGASSLRDLVAATAGPQLTRSDAEARLLELLRRAGMPRPETNVRVAGYEVDFLWRAERLVVEVDGFAFHSSARAFERDRRRDSALSAAGMRVMRITWRQLEHEGEATLVTLARVLWGLGDYRSAHGRHG